MADLSGITLDLPIPLVKVLLGYEELSQTMADRKSDAIVADDAEDHCKQCNNNPRRREVAPTSHTPLDQSL